MAAKRPRKTIGDNPLDAVSQSGSSEGEGKDLAINATQPDATAKSDQTATEQTQDVGQAPAADGGGDQAKADNTNAEPTTAEALFEKESRSQERFCPERSVTVAVVINRRQPKAMAIVKNWAQWSVAAGVVPVPLLDTVAVSGVQLKMIHDLCKFYGVKFEKEAAIGIIASLVGGAITTSLTDTVTHAFLKAVPFAEQVLQPTLAFATTYSLGYVFVKHFEEQGSLKDFKPSAMRGYFREQLARSKAVFGSRKSAAI